MQSDLGFIASLTYGYPQDLYNFIIDTHHTPHDAPGYLFDQVQPRIGMATHLEYQAATHTEVVAGVRAHFDGLFVLGAPDVARNLATQLPPDGIDIPTSNMAQDPPQA